MVCLVDALSATISLGSIVLLFVVSLYIYINNFNQPLIRLAGHLTQPNPPSDKRNEVMDTREQFLSLDRDPDQDFDRIRQGRSTFHTFDFHAEPQGYIQIGQFLLNWGMSDHTGNFSRPFEYNSAYAAVATPRRNGGGEDNIKVSSLSSSYLKLRANGCERPSNFLACGRKKETRDDKVSRITVNSFDDKVDIMKDLAYEDRKQTYSRPNGGCGGPC